MSLIDLDRFPRDILLTVLDASVRALLLAGAAALLLAIVRPWRAAARLSVWTAVLATALVLPAASALLAALDWTVAMPAALWPAAAPAVATAAYDAFIVGAEVPVGGIAAPEEAMRPSWIVIVAAIYLVGVAVLLARIGVGWWVTQRLARGARPIGDDGMRGRFDAIAAARGMTRAPRLLEADRLHVPVTMSALRPAVLLPGDWRTWDDEMLDAVLAHEAAHAARRDPLAQHLALFYRALTWPSPLGWWLRRRLSDLAEQASDEAALDAGADRAAYAHMLVGFFARVQHEPRRAVWHVAMARRADADAERRVDRILNWKGGSVMPRTRMPLVVLALAAAPVVALAAAVQPGASASPATAVAAMTEPPPLPSLTRPAPAIEAASPSPDGPGTPEAAGQAGVKPPPLPPFRAPDQVRANVFGVQLTVASHEAGVPASIVGVGARSTEADGAYASVVVRNHTTTPIRSVVVAAVVRPAGASAPTRMFTSPLLVTWIGAGQTRTLEPRLIDPATLRELGSMGPDGAVAVASLARVEFSDGTVWTPAEPRLPPGVSVQVQAPAAPVPQTRDEFRAGAYRPGAGIASPKVISQVQPKYTREAMQAKIQGIVQVEAVVMTDGSVGDVRVLRSLDRDLGLDRQALEAALQWRFQPAMRNGKPVPIIVIIELEFRLH